MTTAFFDTNVLIYAFTQDARQDRAVEIMRGGGVVSVQSLNELANVLRRKYVFDWAEIREAIGYVRYYCPRIVVMDVGVHSEGLRIAEQQRLSVWDGMIVAAALAADCDILYSEDMHDGLVIDGRLRIVNPFAPA